MNMSWHIIIYLAEDEKGKDGVLKNIMHESLLFEENLELAITLHRRERNW